MYQFLETIQFAQGKYLNLEGHQARVNRTFQQFFPDVAPLLLEEILSASEIPVGYGTYKCRLVYDKQLRQVEYLPYALPAIRSLRLVDTCVEPSCYKHADRTEYNRAFALREECDDVLLIRNGLLTDTSYCNIALGEGTTWFTPMTPMLYGTRRGELLCQKVIVERDIFVQEIVCYPKIRLFNAMIGFGDLEFEITPETVQ